MPDPVEKLADPVERLAKQSHCSEDSLRFSMGRAPLSVLPKYTGTMERQMYVPTETPEPSFMPNGTRNMLAITWSNPAGFTRIRLRATA